MQFRRYAASDLPGILRLCALEHWPSLLEDEARAHRVLTAPGVTTIVAVEGERLLGFAQLQSDGEIQAHLSLVAVDPAARRRGIARELIVQSLREAGGLRIDLITQTADAFYASLPHFRLNGYRLYPNYSGRDRSNPEIVWEAGRKVQH
jgi:ribosomal protein S18 acetylase RimI-like enzyme